MLLLVYLNLQTWLKDTASFHLLKEKQVKNFREIFVVMHPNMMFAVIATAGYY